MAQGLSADVVEQTRRFWTERTGEPVSEENAREAIRNIAGFFDLLASWEKSAGVSSAVDAQSCEE